MTCTDHRRSQAWVVAQASPIIAPVSTSYLDFQELLYHAHHQIFMLYYAKLTTINGTYTLRSSSQLSSSEKATVV